MATSKNLNLKINVDANLADSIRSFVELKKSVRQTEEQFKQAQDKVRQLATEMAQGGQKSAQLSKQFEKAKNEAGKLKDTLSGQVVALNNQRKSLAGAGIDTRNLSQAWIRVRKDLEAGETALKNAGQAASSLKTLNIRPFEQVRQEIRKIESAYQQLKTSGVASQAELNRANLVARQRIRALKSEMSGFGKSLVSVRAQVIGVVAAFAGITAGSREIARVGVQFEGFNNSLKSVLGSQQAATDAMKFLREESTRLGSSLEANVPAFVKIAASAQGTALAGQPVRDIFTSISEASVVLGLSSEQTGGALTAISQIMSKGKVSAEELRGQLGERLPGAFGIAADAMGITTAELDKMLVSGTLLAEDFLPAFANEIHQRFGKSIPDAAQSARASFERMSNAVLELKLAFANSGLLDAIAALADLLTSLVSILGDLTPATKTFLAVLSGVGAGFLTFRFGIQPIAAAISDLLIPAMSGAAVASRGLALALRAIPIVGGALLALELGRWLFDLATGSDDAAEATEKLTDAQKKQQQEAKNLSDQIQKLSSRRADLEKQLSAEVEKESAKRREQQIKDNQAVVKSLEKDIETSKRLQQQYTDEIASRQQTIARLQEDTDDKIRRIEREGFDERFRQYDIQKQITEELARAQESAATDPQEAARLAKKAENLAGELDDRQALIKVLKQSRDIQIEAEQKAIDLAQQRKQAEAEKQQQLEQDLELQKLSLDELISKKAELEKPVTLEIQTNLDEVNASIDALQNKLSNLNANVSAAVPQNVPGLAGGGPIRGPGTTTSDSILARLSRGEYVIKAAAVNKYGLGFIERINQMKLPKFAQGGIVLPNVPQVAGSAAGNTVNITLPGGETFGPFADENNAADALAQALRRETLKRGRRG